MIQVTRLNGTDLWLNPMLMESIESTPDSVVTMTNGHKYVIRESPLDITDKMQVFLRQIGLLASVHRRGEDA